MLYSNLKSRCDGKTNELLLFPTASVRWISLDPRGWDEDGLRGGRGRVRGREEVCGGGGGSDVYCHSVGENAEIIRYSR